MNRNTVLVNSFFFIALVVSIFGIKQLVVTSNSPALVDNPNTPDSYMVNVSYLRTNEQGSHDLLVTSPYVTHYQVQDSANIRSPIIKMFKKDQEWIATAKEAKSFNGMQRLELHQDVKVRQLPSKNKAETTLLTESLTAFPKEDLVKTNEKVTIIQPGLNITGVGMRGDLKNGNIQLLSQTKGHYDPKHYH